MNPGVGRHSHLRPGQSCDDLLDAPDVMVFPRCGSSWAVTALPKQAYKARWTANTLDFLHTEQKSSAAAFSEVGVGP